MYTAYTVAVLVIVNCSSANYSTCVVAHLVLGEPETSQDRLTLMPAR